MPTPLEFDLPVSDRLDHEPTGQSGQSNRSAVDAAADLVEGPTKDDQPNTLLFPMDAADEEPATQDPAVEPEAQQESQQEGQQGEEPAAETATETAAESAAETESESPPGDEHAPAAEPSQTEGYVDVIRNTEPVQPAPGSRRESLAAYFSHQQLVADVSNKLAAAAVNWAKLQEDAKTAKKEFDELVNELRAIVARGPEEMPLFDRMETPTAKYTEAIAVPADPAEDSTLAETPPEEPSHEPQSDAAPANDHQQYEQLLDATPLTDLVLIKDGKVASLKGSLQKLADAGVNSIWDWERLRADVSNGKATYPPRLRRDDMEEAVAQWIAKNWTGNGQAAANATAGDDPEYAEFPTLNEKQVELLAEQELMALALAKPVADKIADSGISNLAELGDAIADRDPTASGTPSWEKWNPGLDEYMTVRRAFCRWCDDNLENMAAEPVADSDTADKAADLSE